MGFRNWGDVAYNLTLISGSINVPGAFSNYIQNLTTLVRAAGNDETARVHWDVTERIRIIRRLDFTRADRIDATYAEHAKILRAVIQRKADAAVMLLKSHIEQSKLEVRKITLHALLEARQRGRRAPG